MPHASLNHYSKGAVASFLHRYVAGLRPAGPGYRIFEVRPRPGGGITSATTRHISPFGPIEVSWQLRGVSLELDVQVPPGSTASVTLPGEPRSVPRPHHWTGTTDRHFGVNFMIVASSGLFRAVSGHDHEKSRYHRVPSWVGGESRSLRQWDGADYRVVGVPGLGELVDFGAQGGVAGGGLWISAAWARL